MSTTCENKNKKRRVEKKLEIRNSKKREFSKVETSNKKECCKFKKVNEYRSLRREKLYNNNNNYYCLIHKEKYICDIYECCGINTVIPDKCDFIPYIV